MPHRLHAEQVHNYRNQGYLIIDEPLFSAEKFAAFKDLFETHLSLWSAVLNEPVELIDRAHFVDPRLNEWLLADEVLDLVEPLIGPDIALFASSCLNKLETVGKSVPWHEDASYWKPLAANRIEAVTLWLAVDPSTTANGCMRVIPGSHRQRDRAHESVQNPDQSLLGKTLSPEQFDESTAVDCVLEPNHCTLHDACLIHGSGATSAQARRCGFQMRYMPTTVKSLRHQGHQVYLARGKDRAGNHYGDPTKVNEMWLAKNPALQQLAAALAR